MIYKHQQIKITGSWLFHLGANLIKKKKLLRKLYEPTLKIYTDEIHQKFYSL